MTYKLKAKAKINLSLDVISKRPDGYHNLRSIMHTVPGLYDELILEENRNGKINIISDKPDMCPPEKNIVYKAYKAFYEYTNLAPAGFDIRLIKNIPDRAGLAGGSSDGAEILKFLNEFHSYPLSEEDLIILGSKIGADIPFLIKGGCSLCDGIGEILTPLPTLSNINLLIVKPASEGLSTPEIFKSLKLAEIKKRPNTEKIITALEQKDIKKAVPYMHNVLEDVSRKYCPQIEVIENTLTSLGALNAMMSGSGNSVFALFNENTDKAVSSLKNSGMNLFISQSGL